MVGSDTILSRGTIIAVGALSSRVTGFVRTAAIGAAIGAGLVGNAYATATMLPGIVYEILLGGVGTAILVPLLNRAQQKSPSQSREYAQRLLTLAVFGFAAAAILATAIAPVLIPVLGGAATTGASMRLTIALALFAVPSVFFYGLGAVATAILNARGRFALPAWAPAFNNLTIITAATVLLLLGEPDNGFGAARVAILGTATLTGAAVQALALYPALKRSGVPWRWRPQLRGLGLRPLAHTITWVGCYVTVGQAAVLVVIGLTRASAAHGGPGPFIYNNAWILLMMAYGILALPVITALTPALSDHTTPGETDATATTYRTGSRLVLLTAAPASAAMIVLAQPIALVLFEWGDYTHNDAVATGMVIAVAATGLVPYALTQLQLFAFLALGTAKTPALIMIASTVARIGLSITAYLLLPASTAAAGMMAAGTISYLITAGTGGRILNTRLPATPSTPHRHTAVIVTAAAVSGGVGWLASDLLTDTLGTSKVAGAATIGVSVALIATAYLAACHLLGVRDLTDLAAARLRRRSADERG